MIDKTDMSYMGTHSENISRESRLFNGRNRIALYLFNERTLIAARGQKRAVGLLTDNRQGYTVSKQYHELRPTLPKVELCVFCQPNPITTVLQIMSTTDDQAVNLK
jgi:hypothetical protein